MQVSKKTAVLYGIGFIPLIFQYHSCQLLTVQELLETVVTEAVIQKSDQYTSTSRYQYGYEVVRGVSIRDWNGPHVIINDSYTNHAPVHIEDHVWLCSGCTILPGVTIGKGSVVAANALVTKDVPPKSLVGGNPAKVIKTDIEWY